MMPAAFVYTDSNHRRLTVTPDNNGILYVVKILEARGETFVLTGLEYIPAEEMEELSVDGRYSIRYVESIEEMVSQSKYPDIHLDTNVEMLGSVPCQSCKRTGRFITHPNDDKDRGICFRCGGKGYHNQEDRQRNHDHDKSLRLRSHYSGNARS